MKTIYVPATTANLGAGYDLIGAALNWHNAFAFEDASDWRVTVQGPFQAHVTFPLDVRNLVFQAFCSVYAKADIQVVPQHLKLTVNVPPARGLGSSSTAITAGVMGALARLDMPLESKLILEHAVELEGHPDNVAPAILGGCVISYPERTGYRYCTLNVPNTLQWVLVYPNFELSTHAAREVVPAKVSQTDAISNMSYLTALLLGFERGDPDLIAYGLNDTLHQPYRMPLIPGMSQVLKAAIDAGAMGAVLSGAGPTLLALSFDQGEAIGNAMVAAWAEADIQAEAKVLSLNPQGAYIAEQPELTV